MRFFKKLFCKKTSCCAAVIVAAGSSSRMKGTDKLLYPLGSDPVIAHSIRAFQENESIGQIIVVTKQELVSQIKELCKQLKFDKVTDITPGGASRAESVMKGLDKVEKDMLYAAVHDAARPFVSQQIISDTVACAKKYHAAAPAVPVKDTIKVASKRIITQTPDRSTLFAVQTPQIFDFDLLRGALTKALKEGTPITDDCSAVEAIGMSVYLTDGSDENLKITTPTDLLLADALWESRVKA